MLIHIAGFKLSEPWIGLLGLLSSVMTIYDIWPEAPPVPLSSSEPTTSLAPPDRPLKMNGKAVEADNTDEANGDGPAEETAGEG